MGYTRCPKCQGDGEVKCPKCDSNAFVHSVKETTNKMFRIQDEPCTRCHDKFVVRCNQCGGTGKVKERNRRSPSKKEYSNSYYNDYSSSSYSDYSTPVPSTVDTPTIITNIISVIIFLLSLVRLWQLVVINVNFKTRGNPFGFFDYVEAGLEFLFFAAIGAGLFVLINKLATWITKSLKGASKVILSCLIILALTVLLLDWLTFHINNQIPFW